MSIKQLILSIIAVLTISIGKASDTLYTHSVYPALVYNQSEFNFYKYTAKYIPKSLFHAFKILGTNEKVVLERFKSRSHDQVIEYGIHYASSRLRKEFCLEGYSNFVFYFHKIGIYYPRAMETFILLSFHDYLNNEKINWNENKKLALKFDRKTNRFWRKRKRKLFRGTKVKIEESKGRNKNRNSVSKSKEEAHPDQRFWGEFE